MDKAVGLQAQGQLQVLGRQVLKVGGVVLGGEGIDFAALGLEQTGELLGTQFLRAPEHKVLKEVTDAGDAGKLVSGADLVMHLQGNHRHRLVREHHQGEAVLQLVRNYGDGGIPG